MLIRIHRRSENATGTAASVIDGHALLDAPINPLLPDPAPPVAESLVEAAKPEPAKVPRSAEAKVPRSAEAKVPRSAEAKVPRSAAAVVTSQIRLARDLAALREEVTALRAELTALRNGLPAFQRGAA